MPVVVAFAFRFCQGMGKDVEIQVSRLKVLPLMKRRTVVNTGPSWLLRARSFANRLWISTGVQDVAFHFWMLSISAAVSCLPMIVAERSGQEQQA